MHSKFNFQRVKQVWYTDYPSTINLKSGDIFTRGLPKKASGLANKPQVKHLSSSLELSISFTLLLIWLNLRILQL